MCALVDCRRRFRGGDNQRYCPDCSHNRQDDIARTHKHSAPKKVPCPQCGKPASPDAKRCRSCAAKGRRETVECFSDICLRKFMPTSWRQAIGAKIVACSDCRKNRRADYNRLAWAARKTKGKSALAMANKMTDRRLRRLLAEVQGSVRVLYDKNKGLGE